MRLAFMAGAAILVAASLAGGHAWAQAAPGRAGDTGAAVPGKAAASCADLPPVTARSVPPPFDTYMRLMCRDPVGHVLAPAEGFRWTTPDGQPIGLLATSAAGSPDADGQRRFPTGWYVELSPVVLSPAEQRRLKKELGRAIRPGFLDKAAILELRARTSSDEAKLIFLVVPDTRTREPAWLIGLECNGACFREDTAPLMFAGSAIDRRNVTAPATGQRARR